MSNQKAYDPFTIYIDDGNRQYEIQIRRQLDNKYKFAGWIAPADFSSDPPTFIIQPPPDLILEKGFTWNSTTAWRPSEGNALEDRDFLDTVGVHINDFLANNIDYQA